MEYINPEKNNVYDHIMYTYFGLTLEQILFENNVPNAYTKYKTQSDEIPKLPKPDYSYNNAIRFYAELKAENMSKNCEPSIETFTKFALLYGYAFVP